MATQKDIDIIKSYKDELASITQFNYSAWHSKVLATLKNVLGQDNDLTKQFFNTSFIEYYTITKPHPRRLDADLEESHTRFNKALGITKFAPILEAVIDYLEKHLEQESNQVKTIPVPPPVKTNFLSHLATLDLLIRIGITGTAIFFIGYYFGTEKVNKESIENHFELRKVRDSLGISSTLMKSRLESDVKSQEEQSNGENKESVKEDTVKHS